MNETIISWNVPNWLTVCLMAFVGFAVFGLAINAANRVKGTSNESA